MAAQISKKRKFVADGVFRAELNEFFTRELAEEGYSGCDVRVTHARTEVREITCIPLLMWLSADQTRSLSVQRTPRKFWERRVVVSANSLHSCRSVSNFLKIPLNCMPRRSSTVDFLPLLSVKV